MRPEDLYIVRENPYLIQRKCQIHGRGIFGKFFLGMMIYYAFDNLLPNILGALFPKGYIELMTAAYNIPTNVLDPATVADTPVIMVIYMLLFGAILQMGRALYALTFIRNRTVEYQAIGEGIHHFAKAILLGIVQSLIISFWTMFFIVPGIIAFYNFRQSYYILADNPEKGVMRILAESKARMLGNRMNLLKLDISYLPLVLMGYMPIMLCSYLYASLGKTGGMEFAIASFVFSIPFFYALSIVLMGHTVFYELLLRHGFENFMYVGQDAFRSKAYGMSEPDSGSEAAGQQRDVTIYVPDDTSDDKAGNAEESGSECIMAKPEITDCSIPEGSVDTESVIACEISNTGDSTNRENESERDTSSSRNDELSE